MNMLGDGNPLDIAAGLDFGSDIFRDVLRPMLKRIEGYNTDRVIELPRHEIGEDSFEVCPLDLGFAVNGAQYAKAVNYEVDGLINAVGHEPWRPAGARHTHLLCNTPTFKHKTGNCSCSKEKGGPGDRAPRAYECRWCGRCFLNE